VKGGFLWLTAIAFAAALALVSAGVGVALAGGGRRLAALAPAARARLLLTAALAPAFAAALLVLALAADVALFASPLHCAERFAAASPHLPALTLLTAWLGWGAFGMLRAAALCLRALAARRRLAALSVPDARGFWRVPCAGAEAFVLGFRRPEVYVSTGLAARADARSLETVIAHERAHVRRREPLRRLAAALALALHLPGVAGALGRALRAAEEASADADAARSLGDRGRVAEALVRFARMRHGAPLAVSFHGDCLEARVREVLAPAKGGEEPRLSALLLAAAAALALALAGAPLLHRATELAFELAAR
jgi:Peptidase family M48